MSRLMDKLLGKDRHSAVQAKERLKLVLIHDRTDLSPGAMGCLKDELIGVISRYIEIDPDAVKINVEHNGKEQRLIADIPLRASSRKRVR